MNFLDTPLQDEVDLIVTSRADKKWFIYEATILPEGEEPVEVIRVTSFDEVNNYQVNYGTLFNLEVLLGLGTYTARVLPFKEQLKISVSKRTFLGNTVDEEVLTYRAILMSSENPTLESGAISTSEAFALDVGDLKYVSFTLVPELYDQLGTQLVGGTLRDTTAIEGLKTLLTTTLMLPDLDSNFTGLGLTVEGEPNDREIAQIVIDHGTSIFDLPGYLQEKGGGIYPTGLGHFIQGRQWYLYPLYDTERFESYRGHLLEIAIVPSNLYSEIDVTYLTDGDVTYILAAGDRQVDDSSSKAMQNQGEGTRFMDAKSLVDGIVSTVEENKAVLSRGAVMNEFVADQPQSGFNKAQMASRPITDNPMRELSRLSAIKGSYFSTVWRFSDPSVIIPGQMARVKYMDGQSLRTFIGTIVGAEHSAQLYGTGATATTHYHSSALTFFVERDLGIEG